MNFFILLFMLHLLLSCEFRIMQTCQTWAHFIEIKLPPPKKKKRKKEKAEGQIKNRTFMLQHFKSRFETENDFH